MSPRYTTSAALTRRPCPCAFLQRRLVTWRGRKAPDTSGLPGAMELDLPLCHRRAVQIDDARAPGSTDCRRPVVEMALFMPFSPSSAPQQMGSWKFLASRSSSRTQTRSSSFLCPQKYRQHSSLVGFGYYGHTTDQACITGSSNRSCNTRTRCYCFRSAALFFS
jgi:hypothetical protein